MALIIQESIKVSEKWIMLLIEDYKEMPENYGLGFGGFSGNRDDIIREIKKRTKIGKQIMLMKYEFEKEYPKLLNKFKSK